MAILIFAVNLPSRLSRRKSIENQFRNLKEFELKIVNPLYHPKPTKSLWISLQQIVCDALNSAYDFFIFCEDDHLFTENFSFEFLVNCITKAKQFEADILLGGVSWQKTSIQVSENLFWVEKFSGLQFTIIFKKFYNKIVSAEFGEEDTADHKISDLTDKKFIVYPSISSQKEFGYSDVTPNNNSTGRVDFLFEKTNHIFNSLNKVRNYYIPVKQQLYANINFDEITLPVYIINLKARVERLSHIQLQFEGRDEFYITVIEAIKDKNAKLGLWKSIVKAVKFAVQSDDDFMILCEDDHVFTEHYNRDFFIENILESYYQKADLLSGGIGGFGLAVPITEKKYWVDWFWCTQFVVIYKQFYSAILNYDFQENDTADGVFSKLSNNKLVLYPFISIQKDFGYSDVTKHNNEIGGLITKFFNDASERLAIYCNVNRRYILKSDNDQKPLFVPTPEILPKYLHNNLIHRNQDAEEIVPYIIGLLAPQNVIDIGCGLGNFLSVFKKHGVKEVLGLDGHWVNVNDLQIEKKEFLITDLERPITLEKRYNLVICLEVAEHINAGSTDTFVENLVNAGDIILFSAAIPGQGGQNHVNEQWPDYWIRKFDKYRYNFYDVLRPYFWNNEKIFWWYKQNMFLVIKDTFKHSFKEQPILNLVHPEHYIQKNATRKH